MLGKFKSTSEIGDGLIGNVDGRLLWLEMMTALNQCLPADPPDKRPEDIADRNEIHIRELECEWIPDLATWYTSGISEKIKEMKASEAPQPPDNPPSGRCRGW